MGLASALSTALTGLNASETTIDIVGNNLANSNTVGFKASNVSFATQFLQTQSLGSSPTIGNGGTNPRQIGLGTMVADISPNFNQGTIEISSNPTDLAIQGDGFFIVQGQGGAGHLYTRNGMFKLNSNNEVVTTTGNRVMGFGIDNDYQISTTTLEPIKIPLGAAAVAQATQNAYLQGTLSPNGALATTGTILETGILGNAGMTAPPDEMVAQLAPTPDMTIAPAATTAVGGNVGTGTYLYRLVYQDRVAPEGSTTPNEGAPYTTTIAVNVDGTTGQNAVTLSGIARPPAGSNLRIYRTDATGAPATFKLVDTVVGPATPTATWAGTYTDKTNDTALGNPFAATPTITGTYTYFVTYASKKWDATGRGIESRPTYVDPVTVSGQTMLTNLRGDDSGQWAVRRIYRNAPGNPAIGQDKYVLVAELDDISTDYLTFTDHTDDMSLTIDKQLTDFDGPRAKADTLVTNLLKRNGHDFERVFPTDGTFYFSGKKGGSNLAEKTMDVVSTSTTVQSLLTFMSGAMGIVSGMPDGGGGMSGTQVTNDGEIQFTGNTGLKNAINIDLSGMRVVKNGVTNDVTLSFTPTQEAVGESATTDFIAYDSLGIGLNVRLTAVLESRDSNATTYRWYADSPQNVQNDNDDLIACGTGLVRFDGRGNLIPGTTPQVTIYRDNVSARSPLVFALDFSQISGLAADRSTLAVSRQDGSAPGVLNSFIVGEDGLIRGVFSNGVTRDLGQIRLARFSNPTGLQQKGENMFASGVNSGLPIEGNPGEQGIGSIIAGATELSNTDIGGNLIDLILASTMYRGNARVITTVQQMLDELLALRR